APAGGAGRDGDGGGRGAVSDKVMSGRCGDVTVEEGEEAVRRGPGELARLKRYTGFGTGWCQGKQCVALASRTLVALGGVSPEAPITPRQPFHPVLVGHLACILDDDLPEGEEEPR